MIFSKIYNMLVRMGSKSIIIRLFIFSHTILLLMMVFTFPRINAKLGTLAFDLKTFGYTQTEARIMLQNLDTTTIDLYLFPQLFLFDILYPILLALFLSTVIIRLSNLIKSNKSFFFSNLFLLPFIAMFIDYVENILVAVMITNPINVSSNLIKTASICTQLKAGFTALSWLVLLILWVFWTMNKSKIEQELSLPN